MIFDDSAYADIPVEMIQKAILAEGFQLFRAEGPIYRFMLFNVDPSDYRIDQPCVVTEHACARVLWLPHPHLGLESRDVERIAEGIEKVMSHIDKLRQ